MIRINCVAGMPHATHGDADDADDTDDDAEWNANGMRPTCTPFYPACTMRGFHLAVAMAAAHLTPVRPQIGIQPRHLVFTYNVLHLRPL